MARNSLNIEGKLAGDGVQKNQSGPNLAAPRAVICHSATTIAKFGMRARIEREFSKAIASDEDNEATTLVRGAVRVSPPERLT